MNETIDVLYNLVGVSKFHPFRKAYVKHYLEQNEMGIPEEIKHEITKELNAVSLDALHLYSIIYDSKQVNVQLVKNAMYERSLLMQLYNELSECIDVQLGDLCSAVEGSTDDDEFWFHYFMLISHLQITSYDYESIVDLCKRCLSIEVTALNKKAQISMTTDLDYLKAFTDYYGVENNVRSELQCLTNHFLQKDFFETLKDTNIDVSRNEQLLRLCERAVSFPAHNDLSYVFQLWNFEHKIINVIPINSAQALRREILPYFRDLTDDVIAYDYIDLVTRKAINDAVNGKTLTEIEVELNNALDDLSNCSIAFSKTEFTAICKLTLSKCTEVLNYA